MNGLAVAVEIEIRKTFASRVVATTTIILVLGVALLVTGFEFGVQGGNESLEAKLGPLAALEGWQRMLGLVAQITSAGALLAFGVVLSWLVGREFADGTVTGLFALPVSRPAIAAAKLVVYLMWVVTVATVLAVALGVAGFALGFGAPDAAAIDGIARQIALTVLTGLVAVPAALAATLGRGLLPGIATTVALLVCAQVLAAAGVGGWFPIAAPALWAITPASVSPLQLGLVGIVPLGFGALTLGAWARLQLDR